MPSIGLILTPGFADWEYAFIAGTAAPYYGVETRFFTPAPGQFRSMGGLAVTVEDGLQQCLDWRPDVVAVIGGTLWEQADAPDLNSFLRTARANRAGIAGICGGTLALARAGLLDTVAHTSNGAEFLQDNAAGYHGGALYQASPRAVASEGIITAAGTAPLSFTCAVFSAVGLAPETIAEFQSMLTAESA